MKNRLKQPSKNLKRIALFAAIFVFLFKFDAAAQRYFSSDAVGTTSGDFLNLDISPRAVAMGGAQTAVAEDVSALHSNPAGLIQISRLSAMFMRTQYVSDISYQYAAYAQRLSYDSVIAASVLMTDIGSIDNTDISGNKLGTFSPQDQVITLGYSKGIIEFSDKDTDVSMGIAYKYIHSKILDDARATAFDLGIMTYNFTYIPYRLSVLMQNLGSGLKYDTETVAIPLTFKIGASLNPFKNLMFATDFIMPKNNKAYFTLGSEVSTQTNEYTKFSVRGGINSQKIRDKVGGFNFGLGMTLHFFSIDYAFVPMGDLGTTHRLSLSFDFPFRSQVFQRKSRSIYSKVTDIGTK